MKQISCLHAIHVALREWTWTLRLCSSLVLIADLCCSCCCCYIHIVSAAACCISRSRPVCNVSVVFLLRCHWTVSCKPEGDYVGLNSSAAPVWRLFNTLKVMMSLRKEKRLPAPFPLAHFNFSLKFLLRLNFQTYICFLLSLPCLIKSALLFFCLFKKKDYLRKSLSFSFSV